MSNTKQVIVIRRWYVNAKGDKVSLRAGKFIAQASHASMAFLTHRLANSSIPVKEIEQEWMDNSFAKVVCQVSSEEELLEIAQKAKAAGLECHVITDSGRTEFGGVATKTCLAIGPDYSDKIDKITGHLSLY